MRYLAPCQLSGVGHFTDAESSREVTAVQLYDISSPARCEPGDLVLGIGLGSVGDVIGALANWADQPPAALVVRDPLAQHADVVSAASRAGTTVLGVERTAEWMHLSLLFRTLVEAGSPADCLPSPPADDLFRVANTIASLFDAPVTIEDPQSGVIAFSEGQERADEARRATILGRRPPDPNYTRMKQHGVFRRLLKSPGPIFVSGRPPAIRPRVVQPVRASGEFLGSIWLVVDEPLEAKQEQTLATAAHTVALHLLRQRVQADAWRVTETATFTSLLNGGESASDAVRRLRIRAPGYQVVAVGTRHSQSLDTEAMLLRLHDGLRLSLSALNRSATTAKIDNRIYAIVPLNGAVTIGESDPLVRNVMRTVVRNHAPNMRHELIIGLGGAVANPTDIARSRDQAERALAVLREQLPGTCIADINEVGAPALLLHLVTAMQDDPGLGASDLKRLAEFDIAKGTTYLETITAWLDAFGDTDAAAARLHVHPNTVRNRIRQIRDLDLVNLDDPVGRLALQIHLYRTQPVALGGESSY